MLQPAKFKCLRCGREYEGYFDPDAEPQERSCHKCGSNSVRRLREKSKREAQESPDSGAEAESE